MDGIDSGMAKLETQQGPECNKRPYNGEADSQQGPEEIIGAV